MAEKNGHHSGEPWLDEQGRLHETDESVANKCLTLASMIVIEHPNVTEELPKLIYLPKGGLGPTNIVARLLEYPTTSLCAAAIGSYKKGSVVNGIPELGQMPTTEDIAGNNVLIIDEVCDTGNTLTLLTDLLKLAGAGVIKTAVLHYKPNKSQTDFVPDWHVQQTDDWIVYPWEVYEDMGTRLTVAGSRLAVLTQLEII